MADRMGLAQSAGQRSDLVGDGMRQEHGRQDHGRGGFCNHRGSVDYSQTPAGDNLARFLGVTIVQRTALGLTTIGACNFSKRARKQQRKHRDRMAKERKRRASGVLSRAEYEANSMAAKAREEGVSRMTIYRRKRADEQAKNSPDVTVVSAAIFLSGEDGPVTPAGVEGTSERGFASKKARGLPSSQTTTTMVADSHEALPIELRLLALGLVETDWTKNLARAA